MVAAIMQNNGLIAGWRKHGFTFGQVAFLSVGLAIIINVISGGILSLYGTQPKYLVAVGVLVLLAYSAALIVYIYFSQRTSNQFEGFITFDTKNREFLYPFGYEFGEESVRYLNACIQEKKYYEKLIRGDKNQEDNKQVEKESGEFLRFLQNVTELFALKKLSLDLNEFYTVNSEFRKFIKEYERADIPDVILSNSVINLLTEDFKTRSPFVDKNINNDDGGETYMIIGGDGTLFEKMSLELPKKTTLSRQSNGVMKIDTDRFRITIFATVSGMVHVVPPQLYTWKYLDLNPLDLKTYEAKISVDFSPKFLGLLKPKGWKFHEWVDRYIASLENDFDAKGYYSQINLNASLFVLEMIDHKYGKIGQAPH